MSGSAYIALTGVRTRMEQLDRLAADLANANTSGYKGERTTTVSVARPAFGDLLDAAVDVTDGPRRVDFSPGTVSATGRELDVAIEGDGFFVVESPYGMRYTRGGHFSRGSDGKLLSPGGFVVQGESGEIVLPPDTAITIEKDGTVRTPTATLGKLQVVTFENLNQLVREGNAMFRAGEGQEPETVDEPLLHAGTLEGSNVSVVEAMARLVEVSRAFDSLQRGIGVVMNDLNSRVINELGRK